MLWYSITSTVYTFGGSADATVSGFTYWLTSAVNTTAKTVTISGTPTASGTYTITTSGHTPCTAATISGTVTVTLTTVSAASSTPTLCINTALTAITHTTTGATGFQK
jgi:hypothetical protein